MTNSVSSRRHTLWQNSVPGKNSATKRKNPSEANVASNDTVYERRSDFLQKTLATEGSPKRRTLKSNSNVTKSTKFLTSHDLNATKSHLNQQRKIKDFKEKLDKITIIPQGKKELKRILEDKDQVKILVEKLANWFSCNNSKLLELLRVFQNKNQNNCIDYTQFIGTMITLQSPFRMMDLCALVIHLSSQHAGFISEEDIKKVHQREDPIKCYKCDMGRSKTQIMKGPFGIVQMQPNIPEMWEATDFQVQTDNRWVKFLVNSLIKKPKPLEIDISSSQKNTRFKSALMAVCKENRESDKSNENKVTDGQDVLKCIRTTVRTHGLMKNWQKKVKTPKDQVEEELITGNLYMNKQSLSQKPTKEKMKGRFKAATAKLTGELKDNQQPRLTYVVERTIQAMWAKKHANQPTDNQRHFLKIPKLDAPILRALAKMQNAPTVFYILLQLRSIVYDSIVSCPAHFTLLLTDDSTLTYISNHIKSVNNLSEANVYISPYRHSFWQSLLPLENTLKRCGFKGYCKSHPHEITLYYDFEITYTFTYMKT